MLDQFTRDRRNARDGRHPYCRQCRAAVAVASRQARRALPPRNGPTGCGGCSPLTGAGVRWTGSSRAAWPTSDMLAELDGAA